MIENMLIAELNEILTANLGNKGNGYRPGYNYGHGRKQVFRIPRDRYGNFHPRILELANEWIAKYPFIGIKFHEKK